LQIRPHLINVVELKPGRLRLARSVPLSLYPVKRFYQYAETMGAGSLCKRVRELAENGRSRGFQFIASDARAALGQKTNVVEEAVKRFVGKFAGQSIEQLGGPDRAAEFLGVTRGELRRLLEHVPAVKLRSVSARTHGLL